MSFFPQTLQEKTVKSMASYAAFATRIDLGTGVRGNVAAPQTYTTAAFTIPSLYDSVTISVNSTTNFVVGDFVMVGTRGMYLTSPVHATTGPGVLNFEGRYFAGRLGSADGSPSGLLMIGSNGLTTTTTANIAALPNYYNPGGTNNEDISVANRANIPSNSWVLLTNYAGVYKVTNVVVGALTLQYVTAGDIPVGGTCIVDTSASDLGAQVVQFHPLGVVPAGFVFNFTDAYMATVSVSGATASTTNISIGWGNSQYSGPATRMAEFVDNTGQQAGSVLNVNGAMSIIGQNANTENTRYSPMSGMAFGLRVNTPGSTSFVVDLIVRGLMTPFV